MSLNALITDSENLDEKLSAVEFIKTLKKVDTPEQTRKAQKSGESSTSGSSDKMAVKGDDDKKKLIEKKPSASDLLVKMRSRFQHRATEPVFHTLANASETSLEQQSSRSNGSDNALRLPQIETLSRERRTDSAPANIQGLSRNKYLRES
ncbi:hypothetical protein Y032_0092g2544 [Ancylostoma ceylanicum]|uniref:Uncharacterized protein n=1 Tax=Ancylostoma ceylanicum TaxID=53326 RepID=A0A016TLQ6_9BILA|nr:hypothetical protein Y032_0092g2544 [Ancylostoma ceylanicum]